MALDPVLISDRIEAVLVANMSQTNGAVARRDLSDQVADEIVLAAETAAGETVLEYVNLAAFPVTGEVARIYVAKDTNYIYRWDVSAYVAIGLALGETSATAYRGDRGKDAYDHSQATGNPHSTAMGDITGLDEAMEGKFSAPMLGVPGTIYKYTLAALSSPSLANNQTFAKNYISYYPWYVFSETTLTELGIRVTTALVSGGTGVAVGVYSSTANRYPGDKVCQFVFTNRVATDQYGTLASPVTIPPGLYWIAIGCAENTAIRTIDPSTLPIPFSYQLGTTAQQWGYRGASTYSGTLPPTAPAGLANAQTHSFAMLYA